MREEFIEAHRYWTPFWDGLLELDKDFFEAYTNFSSVPWRTGPLEPKVKEFVYIAVDAAATHLYVPGSASTSAGAGLRRDGGGDQGGARAPRRSRSTRATSASRFSPRSSRRRAADFPGRMSERQRELKADFEEKRGYWHSFWEEVLLLDPDFFEAYTRFSSVPWVSGVLEPKIEELIYTAFDVSATHLYMPGLRLHIKNAIGYGATREEILEVIELASIIGIHSCTEGVPI